MQSTAMMQAQAQAERLAERFAVHWVTIYRYRARLCEIDAASAVAGHKRGWKPLASRLLIEQEEAIGEAIACLRKKAVPLRVVDLVAQVSALCRLKQVSCPSPVPRPAIDLRFKRARVRVQRRGVAAPSTADPQYLAWHIHRSAAP